jgi:hypothetical protein
VFISRPMMSLDGASWLATFLHWPLPRSRERAGGGRGWGRRVRRPVHHHCRDRAGAQMAQLPLAMESKKRWRKRSRSLCAPECAPSRPGTCKRCASDQAQGGARVSWARIVSWPSTAVAWKWRRRRRAVALDVAEGNGCG